ncbi:probable E3 ubiquitin ligase complex SCF subunit sconB [Nasonia vitripennis]|uniref:F-box domain-containing protein n=1 Tax=Nasonia vitripennis TaxID=7425 RepID=A0A7M7QFB0_NASVI|nr:probable E3 ubiquitin ligase complex SCF subunit sconB [Nasonia vitripennis]
MDSFRQLMIAMGVHHQGVDFIRELPVELSQIILSKLDTKSLLNAAQVSRKWLAISKSTSSSRQRVRRHIRRRNQKLAQVLPPPPSKQFTTRIMSKPMIIIPQTKIPYPALSSITPLKHSTLKFTQSRKVLRL